jgi:ABC-type Fe3+-hydroxamate transport system substrate-binding protein
MHTTVVDQLSRTVLVPVTPMRIISIVPSQTELLFDLGLADRIIGVTKFCNHPSDQVRSKTKVGGTKQLNIERIRNLKPDLIIGNKEENERSQVEVLMQEFPVWMSDIANLSNALEMIQNVGHITSTSEKARAITHEIQAAFDQLVPPENKLKVAYLIWQGPLMTAGRGTFIDDMLHRCGFINVTVQQRYPHVTSFNLQLANPDIVMLSSEPYPFKQKHIQNFEAMLPGAKIILVDGEMFSWYGGRLLLATEYFKQLIADLSF